MTRTVVNPEAGRSTAIVDADTTGGQGAAAIDAASGDTLQTCKRSE
jgi:hypothetical protein